VTTAFVTDEGAFLRGQIRMEETVELDLETGIEPTILDTTKMESTGDTPVPAARVRNTGPRKTTTP
jgi:hypothetical protein